MEIQAICSTRANYEQMQTVLAISPGTELLRGN